MGWYEVLRLGLKPRIDRARFGAQEAEAGAGLGEGRSEAVDGGARISH
jgi:hypothetical protein